MRQLDQQHEPLIFDRTGIREVDRRAIDEFGMSGLVLMENAARAASQLAIEMLNGSKVVIACGPGNNGGDGYAMARHLHNAGAEVVVVALTAPRTGSDAETNARIAQLMGLKTVEDLDVLSTADLVIDAMLGTGLDRPVKAGARDCIEMINRTAKPTLAIDIPSGLDADTGQPLGTAVHATATATFVGWKRGFLNEDAKAFTGALHVVDIGIPASLAYSLCLKQPD
ncbi:MAG: NAD(P)H-hydrate epimerase [Phycisphaerales bacterium]|nr:NAD(P)H-hydrate epimerase [Phycisphaerales bacterium]